MDFEVPQLWSFEEDSWEDLFPSLSEGPEFKYCQEEDHSDDSWMGQLSCEPLKGVVITDEVIADALMSEEEDLGIYLNETPSKSADHINISLSSDIIAGALAASRDYEDLGIHLADDITDPIFLQMSPSPVSSATSGFHSLSDYDALSPWSIGSPASPQVFNVAETRHQRPPKDCTAATMVSTPVDGSLAKWLNTQMEPTREKTKSESRNSKPPESYLALIAKAILSMPSRRALLSDIYKFSTDNYEFYRTAPKTWQNAIRHNLSVNAFFIKNGRAPHGRGFYWSIHPACLPSFLKGDFRRREAQQLVTASERLHSVDASYYVYVY